MTSKRVVREWSTEQRRQRAAGDDHLSGNGSGEVDDPLEAAHDDPDRLRVACRVHRDLQRTECLRQIDRRDARSAAARRWLLVAQVDLVAVEEPTGEAEPGQSVGHDVVGAQVQRGAAALEALDQRAVPRRMVGVEGNRFDQTHEVEQLAERTRPADRGSPQVMLGVGRVVFEPQRARLGERRIAGPRLQPRRTLDDRVEAFHQQVVAGCAVETPARCRRSCAASDLVRPST